jgi:NAD(P)-dependent dehydrogenase (short-subunit alcohol dehydrogenase family)
MARLAGKVAYITGAGAGIARAASRLFAREGARVAVVEINEKTGAETVDLIRADGGEATFVRADVSDADSVAEAIAGTVKAFGRLDIIYNCAGGSAPPDDSVTEMPLEAWWRSINLDLYGTFLGCRFGIPELRKAGGGSIINMSSVMGLIGEIRGFPARHSYSSAKGGISALTRCVAAEYARDGIRCNAIAPCFIESERNVGVKTTFSNAQIDSLNTVHRLGTGQPDDIANAALYFASDQSRLVTGVVLPVDSGMLV